MKQRSCGAARHFYPRQGAWRKATANIHRSRRSAIRLGAGGISARSRAHAGAGWFVAELPAVALNDLTAREREVFRRGRRTGQQRDRGRAKGLGWLTGRRLMIRCLVIRDAIRMDRGVGRAGSSKNASGDQRLTMIARARCRLATSRRSALADRDAAGESGGRPRSWSHPNNRWGRIGGPTS